MAHPTSGILTPLIPFELIIDTDLGIINYIKDNYPNNDIWDKNAFKLSQSELKYDLLHRAVRNPLFIIANDYNKNALSMNNLYNEFMDREYKEILEYSTPTLLLNAVKLWCKSQCSISTTIFCKNQLEQSKIQNIIKCNTIVYEGKFSEFITNTNIYDTIYIKYSDNLLNTKIEGKNIYIADYQFNMIITAEQEKILDIKPIQQLIGINEIKIFSLGGQENNGNNY